jgi:PHP family Zn ribbon phosphoesterase
MEIIADLHLHSKYSRAVSPQMIIPEMAKWAKIKGIDLMGSGDFTHPLWFRELKANLEKAGEGIYYLKGAKDGVKFLLTTEVACIYRQDGQLRRIHLILMAPDLAAVEKINQVLGRRGNLMADGRPIFEMTAREMADLVLNASPEALIIPAHIWTPHFSLYGSQSGFDSLEECFGNFSKQIRAIETGLSSDPGMNWRIGELDSRAVVSFSDAHSGPKLGREATVFEIEDIKKLRYEDIRRAIMGKWEMRNGKSFDSELRTVELLDKEMGSENSRNQDISLQHPASHFAPHISYTIEFYPEEGKYHWTGHRSCKIKHSPEQSGRLGTTCPVCGKGLTIGVMHRVQQLAGREIDNGELRIENDSFGVKRIGWQKRPPYLMLVPLIEIIAQSLSSTVSSQKTLDEYKKLTGNFEGEFGVLLKTETSEISKISGPKIAEGIKKVRKGDLVIDPGYDGVFGTVKIWSFDSAQDKSEEKEQLALF